MTQTRVPHRPRRRRLLPGLLAAAAVGTVIAAAVGAHPALQGAPARAGVLAEGPVPSDTPRARARTLSRARYEDSLRDPVTVRSVNGVLNATLTVEPARLPVHRSADSVESSTCGRTA
jgi:hypothetical protein